MKKFTLLMAIVLLGQVSKAQEDTLLKQKNATDTIMPSAKNDTIRVGNILIIKKNKSVRTEENDATVTMERSPRQPKKNSKVSTNWFVLDLGFSNYDDQTDYATAGSYLANKPGSPALGAGDFKLRTGKSINVNVWFFMQRMSLVKNYVNLKYGIGLELNNYRYKSPISYKENGVIPYSGGMQTSNAFVFRDSVSFSKNKLAADYLTVPFMINFNSNPNSSKKGLRASAGVSAGYLYSQRNKQKSDARGKEQNKGEYDMERLKLSYIAELGLGPVLLYGSYSPKSMYENGLNMRPYTVGFRFSNW
jgi:Outer membrane protein beta-barrel domain